VLGTGPSNPLGYCLLECYLGGVKAYFEYRNSLGGVHGRKLIVGRTDDDEVGGTKVKALEIIEDKNVFGVFASPLIYGGFPDFGQAKIPVYTTFPAAAEANGFDSMYLPTGTTCISCTRRQGLWAAKLAKATKVASLGFGISPASKDCVANNKAAFEKWGPDIGAKFVYSNDDLAFGLPNGLGPEVTAMKAAGVDFITTCIDQNSALTLEQELNRQGMASVVVVLPQGYGDEAFLTKNAALLEGDMLSTSYLPIEAAPGNSMLATMLEWTKKGGGLFNDYNIQGWINADIAVTGLLAAGSKFDRAGVVAATNKITDYTAGGLVAPVDWSRQHNAPTPADPVTNGPKQDCAAFLFVKAGKPTIIGDATKPFNCFDPKNQKWVEPTPATFG
jgi:branched-chain amino acid transport system substrate-binding protein